MTVTGRAGGPGTTADGGAAATAAATAGLTAVVCGIVAGVAGTDRCRPTDDLVEHGIDSLRAGEAAAVLEDALGLDVPLEAVLHASTPREVAEGLVRRWLDDGHPAVEVRARIGRLTGEGA
jgi:hypothetical protein